MTNLALNNIKPAKGSKTASKRLGRGIGSTWGKTAGRGHKGQHARKGGYHKIGFEGGQTPLQRSLRKFGFRSAKQLKTTEIRLGELEKLSDQTITLELLKAKGLVNKNIQWVKVINTGTITKPITTKGISVTKGAQSTIESLKGNVER